MKKKKIELEFINKRGEWKKVKFDVDELSYKAICDESVSEEYRHKWLVDEYHEQEREKNRNRRYAVVDIDTDILTEDTEIDIWEYEDLYIAISKLTPRQQEFVKLKFFEGFTQEEIAKKYGITKQSVSDAMRRIYETLKKHIKE